MNFLLKADLFGRNKFVCILSTSLIFLVAEIFLLLHQNKQQQQLVLTTDANFTQRDELSEKKSSGLVVFKYLNHVQKNKFEK